MKKFLILALTFILSMNINAKNHFENALLNRYDESAYNITRNILRAIPTHELQFIVNLFAQSLMRLCSVGIGYPLYKEFRKVIESLRQHKKPDYMPLIKKLAISMITIIIVNPISVGIARHYAEMLPINRW